MHCITDKPRSLGNPKQAVALIDRKTVPRIAKNTLNSVDFCAKEHGGLL
jgi:hypothetical protein